MAGSSKPAPIIVKRKKKIVEAGHHGGAWKVAYADFVTAMMAFFLLMWLLNATTEKQRKGLSDYFNPTISAVRSSGGGEAVLNGASVATTEAQAQMGTGGITRTDAESMAQAAQNEAEVMKAIETALLARGGESHTMEQLLRHVVTRVTDEGLVVELFDLENAALFEGETATPRPVTIQLLQIIAEALNISANQVAVTAHLRRYPMALVNNPGWRLSSERAGVVRSLLEASGLSSARFQRIVGFSDRKPVVEDTGALRNNRVEIILLRHDR